MTLEYDGDKVRCDENDLMRINQHSHVSIHNFWMGCAGCDFTFDISELFKCLYCWMWFCEKCAEEHFGKTREQWREEEIIKLRKQLKGR